MFKVTSARIFLCCFLATSLFGLACRAGCAPYLGRTVVYSAAIPSAGSPLRTCSLARYTMAEPIANWVRLSLPVLVIAAVAPAAAVTTYVALRAIYGAARITIQQVARVASVEILRLRTQMQWKKSNLCWFSFFCLPGFIGTGVAGGVVLDNLRLLSLWLKHFDRSLFKTSISPLPVAAPFYSFQVIVALSFSIGQLSSMARRQYAYVLYSAAFAARG